MCGRVARVNARAKGRKGESDFARLLTDRDHTVIDTTAGKACCDIVSIDTQGRVWAWEVKNRRIWSWTDFRNQARKQATGKTRWALALHIPNTSCWLVERQGERPVVWEAK